MYLFEIRKRKKRNKSMMQVEKVVVGELLENCYILSKENHCFVIDPGADFDKIQEKIGSKKVEGVLLTHHHWDHIGALSQILSTYQTKCYDDKVFKKDSFVTIGSFSFQVIVNPGHSQDSISFYFPEEQSMFVGDFIFQGSIGRCDLDGGNFLEMQESLEKLKTYPKETKLYPGHGPDTILATELSHNPYLRSTEKF